MPSRSIPRCSISSAANSVTFVRCTGRRTLRSATNPGAYIKDDTFKSPQFVVHQLVDIVSKNGNLLLNIGPRSDGTIPDEVQQVLRDVGSWLDGKRRRHLRNASLEDLRRGSDQSRGRLIP